MTPLPGTYASLGHLFEFVSDSLDDEIIEKNNNIDETPVDFLVQNYPNPFNPSTQIKYSVKDDRFVTIKIYDILGNEITTLVNEPKPAGSYTVDFNASNLPAGRQGLSSGVYIYTIKANEFIASKKMILTK